MKPRLDKRKIEKFRTLVNSTPIFNRDERYSKHWNLICSFMDRINDSSNSLIKNEYLTDNFGSSDNLILFLVHTDIIVEAIKKFYLKMGLLYPLKDDNSIFNQLGNGRGTDDRFFKHIRALSFAHSVETSHSGPYVQKGEIQYSPFIINGATLNRNKVIIRVYTSLSEEIDSLRIPKRQFIKYVEKRYNLIDELNNYLEEKIQNHIQQELSKQIEISNNTFETLENLKQAAIRRYDDSVISYINEILYVLNYQSDNEKNINAVKILKTYIIENLNDFVLSYQLMDESYNSHPFMNALSFNWNTDYQLSHYILEKIRSYLSEDSYGLNNYYFDNDIPYDPNTQSNVEWGFQQLKIFKEMLADMYVDIDYSMTFNEIQLLVSTALFLDNQ